MYLMATDLLAAFEGACDDDLARLRPGIEHAVTLGAPAEISQDFLRDLQCVRHSVRLPEFPYDFGGDAFDSRSGLVAAAEVIIRTMRESHFWQAKADLEAALALLAAMEGLDAELVPGVRLAVYQLMRRADPYPDFDRNDTATWPPPRSYPDLTQSVVSGLREALDESIHLPAGTTVNATIRLGPSLIGLAVPAEAVVNGGEVGVGGVYRVHPDGKRYVPLELLGQESGGYVHVRGELSPGDHVLLNPRPGD